MLRMSVAMYASVILPLTAPGSPPPWPAVIVTILVMIYPCKIKPPYLAVWFLIMMLIVMMSIKHRTITVQITGSKPVKSASASNR